MAADYCIAFVLLWCILLWCVKDVITTSFSSTLHLRVGYLRYSISVIDLRKISVKYKYQCKHYIKLRFNQGLLYNIHCSYRAMIFGRKDMLLYCDKIIYFCQFRQRRHHIMKIFLLPTMPTRGMLTVTRTKFMQNSPNLRFVCSFLSNHTILSW